MDVIEPGSSGRAETDTIVEGPKWAGTTITFSFPTLAGYADYGGADEVANNFEAFNEVQQEAVRTILAQISSFTGLTFVELSGSDAANATLRFAMSDDPETAYAYLPTPSAYGGDAWFNNSSGDFDNPVQGNYAWMGMVHEIGHALGLGHPHEASPPLSSELDWLGFTVMSYRSRRGAPIEYTNGDWGFAQTYMREDFAALQFLYGGNFSYRATDTTYAFSPSTGEMFVDGIGQGAPGANVVFLSLWDGGGIDTLDLSNYVVSLSVDISPGGTVRLAPEQGADLGYGDPLDWNVAFPYLVNGDPRSLIENVIGSSSDDQITGNQLANRIVGGAGSDSIFAGDGDDIVDGGDGYDSLWGAAGNDRLMGGAGYDRLDGGDGEDYLEGGQDNDTLDGGEGNDTLIGGSGDDYIYGSGGVDRLDGGDGNDWMEAGDGDDVLIGGNGNDRLNGGLGADHMVGGLGDDIYYLLDAGDTFVELPGEGIDSVITNRDYTAPDGIENVDILEAYELGGRVTGNAANNDLRGSAGSDVLDGLAGADIMYGRDGDDVFYVDNVEDVVMEIRDGGYDVVYSSVSFVLLSTPPQSGDPYAGASVRLDPPFEVEELVLIGSADIDATGSEIANILRGNSGSNILSGLAGNDILIGMGGDDRFIGGEGSDTVVFTWATGAISIDLVTDLAAASAAGCTFDSIENVVATDFDDVLIGNASDNVFTGGTGSDRLVGGAGIDTASYAGDEGGVFVNLTLGRGYGNASFGDTYDSIENVIGTDYNDFIIGDPGTNRLDGGGGDDTIIGAVGPDEIIGGTGLDWASYEDNSGTVFVNLTLRQGFNNAAHGDTYEGIENLIGGLMDDFFIGDEQANRLNGAMGADTLLGAGGADIFMFTYAPGATSTWGNPNVDLILDFTTGVDRIELSAGAFPGLAAGALPAAAFYAGTAAHDGDDRIVYDAASGKLWFDPDGNGAQAAMLFATLGETSHPAAIAASDFVVV